MFTVTLLDRIPLAVKLVVHISIGFCYSSHIRVRDFLIITVFPHTGTTKKLMATILLEYCFLAARDYLGTFLYMGRHHTYIVTGLAQVAMYGHKMTNNLVLSALIISCDL